MSNDSLSVPLQLQLLALLCYSVKNAHLVRNALEIRMFASTVHRRIVERVYAYLDEFHCPPQDHLSDLIEDMLDRKVTQDSVTPEDYADVLESIASLRDTLDEDFVLTRLGSFVRQQALRTGIVQASDAFQAGDLDAAESALNDALRTKITVFSPGIRLSEGISRIGENLRSNLLSLGIKPLDDAALGPARGELQLMIAPPKRGKSWYLVHVGKQALLMRLNVLHITLEISEHLIAQRYIQSLFSVQRTKAKVSTVRLHTDDLGRVYKLERHTLRDRVSFKDADVKKLLATKLGKFHAQERLLVKAFPTGALSVSGLRSYLDMLERTSQFIPDVLIIDYPDLMRVSANNYRIELGVVFKDLRGIAVERNLALVVATQSNRTGASVKMLTDVHTAEDYSKIATADTVLTYSQTAAEKELGLARIYVSNTRVGDDDRFVVLVTQAYRIGQFALDAALCPAMYDNYLDAVMGKTIDESTTV